MSARIVLALAGVTLVAAPAVAADSRQIFATPDGKGTACTAESPCALAQVQRNARAALKRGAGVEVLLAGHFELTAPLVLDAADSGRRGAPAVWRAADGKVATLDASRPISGTLTDSTYLIAAAPGDKLTGLLRDGRMAELSASKACPDCTITREGVVLPKVGWGDLTPGAIVAIHARWRDFHCRVTAIQGTLARIAQPCWQNSWVDSKNGWRNATPFGKGYLGVEAFRNVALETDTYAIDAARRTLSYRQTKDGKRLKELGPPAFRIATGERLVTIAGTAARPAHDIELRGLRFTGTGWDQDLTDDGYVSLQAGWYIAGPGRTNLRNDGEGHEHVPAAIDVSQAERIVVTDGIFHDLGTAGIGFGAGVRQSAITGSRFFRLGGGAVFAGLTTVPMKVGNDTLTDFTVRDNDVGLVAQRYRDNVGIMVGYVHGLTLASNWVHDLPYTGISVGWGWNYAGEQSNHRDIRIERNRIDHVMQQLQDGGAIYTQGVSTPTSIITRNYVDMRFAPDGNGIYLDEKSTNFDVRQNVVLGSWISTWSTWAKNLNINGNWTDGRGTEHYPGPTKNWAGNFPNIVELPPEAARVAAEAGPRLNTARP